MRMVEISDDSFEFLKENSEPLIDTAATTLDRLLAELRAMRGTSSSPPKAIESMEKKFGARELPSVTHTKIISASVDGQPVEKRDWNHLLAATMNAAASKGASKAQVLSCASVNVVDDLYEYSSYPVKNLDLSFQGVDAKRACQYIAALAQQTGVAVNARVQWYVKDGAAYPGEQATLQFGT